MLLPTIGERVCTKIWLRMRQEPGTADPAAVPQAGRRVLSPFSS